MPGRTAEWRSPTKAWADNPQSRLSWLSVVLRIVSQMSGVQSGCRQPLGAHRDSARTRQTMTTNGCASRDYSDHDPREEITKRFLLDDMVKRNGLTAGFYKVNYDRAIARPQGIRRNLDNS